MQRPINELINYDGIRYFFFMNNHLRAITQRQQDASLRKIAQYIGDNWNGQHDPQGDHNWIYIWNSYYVLIDNFRRLDLFLLLDDPSQNAITGNYLVFFQTDYGGVRINHFGPFGQVNDKILKKKIQQKIDQRQKRQEAQRRRRQQQQWDNNPDNQYPPLPCVLQASECAGKIIVKSTVKQSAKIGAKKIPGIGFSVGLGLGIYRAFQGDWVGAVAQILSGTVSMIPGPGTALSLAIDVALCSGEMIAENYKNKNLKPFPIKQKMNEQNALCKQNLNELQYQKAINFILTLPINQIFDVEENLADLLFQAQLTKEQINLITQALPKIQDNFLNAHFQVSFQNQIFMFEYQGNGQAAIYAKYGTKVYLSVINGTGKVYANKTFCDDQQKFYIQKLKDQTWTIKTLKGFYLTSDKNGEVRADSKEINEYSIFELMRFKDGSAAFRDWNYKYLSISTLITSKQIWTK